MNEFIANFDLIRSKPSKIFFDKLENIDLSLVKPIISNEQALRDQFKEIVEGWKSVFSPNKVAVAFKTGDRKYLKKMRRVGVPIKTFYKNLGINHTNPQMLENIIFGLGRWFDLVSIKPVDEVLAKKYELMCLDVTNLTKIDNFKYDYSVISMAELVELINTKIDSIYQQLGKSRLRGPELHSTRKDLKIILNIYQIPAVHDVDGVNHWIFYSLYKLSYLLGKIHDSILSKSDFYGESYAQSEVEIDKDLLRQFEVIIPYIERSFGLCR